jgi:outer membrane lipase/esterase
MALSHLRLAAACLCAALLTACGGGIADPFTPTRVLAFGDGFADLGQNGSRYTINDGTVNNWLQYVAETYGRTVTASASGGLDYAAGNARVNTDPDAAGATDTLTVKQQIDAFLALGVVTSGDLVVLGAGTADVIAEAQAVIAGSQTEEVMTTHITQAAVDYAAQVRRLVTAGATHVVVVGPYNLGRSPWAQALERESLLLAASSRFNEQLLISIADLGENVLYVDAAYYFNLVSSSPTSYSLSNVADPACTSVDAGAGIGTGTGQVNSNLCTVATLAIDIDPAVYLFADRVYVTPVAQRLFGAYAYERITSRW